MSPIDLIGFLDIPVGLGGATYFEGAALAGIDPGLLYRVAAVGCGAHGSLPHQGIPGAMIALSLLSCSARLWDRSESSATISNHQIEV